MRGGFGDKDDNFSLGQVRGEIPSRYPRGWVNKS